MTEKVPSIDGSSETFEVVQRELYFGLGWHAPGSGRYAEVRSPSTGELLGSVADASASDVDLAVAAAQEGFAEWQRVPPLERGKSLRAIGELVRRNARELAMLDALDGGNPVRYMLPDMEIAASTLEFFAGLVTEIKGASIPMGPDVVNFSVREPLGVVARIVAFNHPLMFAVTRMAAPLAAGNAVIIKPSEQAPLSTLRFAEIIHGLLPAGVFSVLTGGKEVGAALAAHSGVSMITLVGSVPTGRAVMRAAADTLKPVLFELGGKNALIAYADADPDEVAAAAVAGMNFTWCGQSCGSTSRVFLHEAIHDAVVERIIGGCAKYRPGLPADPATTMGAIINQAQHARILAFIRGGVAEGARIVCGGGVPCDESLARGYFIEPTVFTGVTPDMKIASEEIFGPVMSVLRWRDEGQMLKDVNSSQYGLTCSIWTNDLHRAHRTAGAVQAGFVWVNEVGKHFVGAPFGGYKQSGIGREESLGELLAFTQEKNIHVRIKNSAKP